MTASGAESAQGGPAASVAPESDSIQSSKIPGLGGVLSDHPDATAVTQNVVQPQQPEPQTVEPQPNEAKMLEEPSNETTEASIAAELRDLLAPANDDGNAPTPATVANSVQTNSTNIQIDTGANGQMDVDQETTNSAIPDIQVNGASATDVSMTHAASTDHQMGEDGETGEAEWEVDSSPYESSSEDSSSDDSSDSDEDDDPDYAMLDPEEQARILMQDAGSDDEGPSKGGKSGGHLRTANERQEEVIPIPDIVVTPEMAIHELGPVEFVVEDTVLVRAKISGEYRVLESGSLLCLQDRKVVGIVAETLGRVEEPLYTIRFTNDAAVKEAGLSEKGTPVYYVEQHSTFVFTQPLKAIKGSDASNVNDEEVGEDEIEFSDDEAEADYKRQLKEKRQNRRDARNGVSGSSKNSGKNNSGMHYNSGEINYDDSTGNDDGYTPLSRPANLHEMMGQRDAPTEGLPSSFNHTSGGGYRGRGRGDGHQRPGRGRGRPDRGRGGRNDYSSRVNEQRGYHPLPQTQSAAQMAPPGWPQQPQVPGLPGFQPPAPYAGNFQMPQIPGSQPMPIPRPPSLTPQSQYPSFTPSPISPLPSSQFQWPVPLQQTPPGVAMPPGQAAAAASYFNLLSQQYAQGQPPAAGQQPDNSAAFAQVQAHLEMLRRFGNGNNMQQPGGSGEGR